MKKLMSILFAALLAMNLCAQSQEVRYFSHRGGRMEYDENTLSAFEASYAAGYRGFETDVRLTVDGEMVILHDSNLKRTTDMEGKVEEMTAAQIRKATTKGGHKVMFLDDLIGWLNEKGDVKYVEFELKTKPGLYPEDRLYELCDKLYAKVTENTPEGADYIFTSGDFRALLYIKHKHPQAPMLAITSKPCCKETIDLCKALGINRLGATMDGTTREAVKQAHESGLIVSLWPGRSTDDAVLGAYLGADYLCTDVPVAVKNFLEQKMPWIKAEY